MRPQPQQVFRIDAASRLDDVELLAALLERDATNIRAHFAERGSPLEPIRRRKPSRMSAFRRHALRGVSFVRRVGAATKNAALHPRLYAGLRAAYAFGVDFVVVLASVVAGLATIAGAFLIGAPPV